ncbi:MAG: hypothetical protein CM15mP121_2000 [Bacteroidota bacterium]|nr:MAG: hypothetical protein CM15mP121_2000 [Bacteroidota bacterium]
MIIRGNLVYNNWNRIPFYVTQLPDNSETQIQIMGLLVTTTYWMVRGIYVTRSDPGYNGLFFLKIIFGEQR